jgi:hypothetical protein
MTTPLEDVRHLAGTIGPRGTGTPAEAAAADYVSGRLTGLGLAPERHPLHTVASQNVFPIAISLLALLAALVYTLAGALTRGLAAGLSFFAAWSLWQTIRNAFNPIEHLLPKLDSQNVEARLKPRRQPTRRAVLLAHLDTNRCRLVWQSLTVRSLEPMTWLTLSVPFLMGLLYLAGAILGGRWWWWLSFPLAAYELGALVTLVRDDRTPYSPGAHDNAASVAVALEVAARLKAAPLENTEVWFVFDGAEETDHAGVLDLLRRHGKELRSAAFFGLEGLGSGELVYLTRQGLCAPYHPDPDLLAAAERVAANQPEFEFHPAEMLAEDDVRSLRGRRYRAIGIAGRDPQTGILPHWHRPDDTPETVSSETMARAADILVALLKELDR